MARLRRRSSIIARTTSTGSGGPTPAACERMRACCSSERRRGGIFVAARAPKPVEMPYTGVFVAASLSTRARLRPIAVTARGASSTRAPLSATSSTSAEVSPEPRIMTRSASGTQRGQLRLDRFQALLVDHLQHAPAQLGETLSRQRFECARAGQVDIYHLADPARTHRHHVDDVAQARGLVDVGRHAEERPLEALPGVGAS